MDRFLVTGALQASPHFYKQLKHFGIQVDFVAQELEQLSQDLSMYRGVICNGLFLHNDFSLFTNLRFVHLTSAGTDRIPLERMQQQGIQVHTARGVYSVPMAEWALAGILAYYKQFDHFYRAQQAHRWDKCRTLKELASTRALIIGMGSVGQEVAKRLQALGVHVAGADLYPQASSYFEQTMTMEDVTSQLKNYDQVVLSLPLTTHTRHLVNASFLKEMRSDALLVNIARGAIVDEQALIQALHDKTIGGAVLDVFEQEPLPATSPLWEFENVLLSPHNSFVSPCNQARLEQLIITHIRHYYGHEKELSPHISKESNSL